MTPFAYVSGDFPFAGPAWKRRCVAAPIALFHIDDVEKLVKENLEATRRHNSVLNSVIKKHAYLIVICDPVTNEIKEAAIWSSPEWEQSRQLNANVYIAFSVKMDTFQEGIDYIRKYVADPKCRYHKYHALLEKEYGQTC